MICKLLSFKKVNFIQNRDKRVVISQLLLIEPAPWYAGVEPNCVFAFGDIVG